jgi:hypothetical protein
MWTVDHEADIASDLSAFHRIDDVDKIDGPRYFSLAQRLTAYSGVMGAIVATRAAREREGKTGTQRAPGGGDRQVVDDSVALAQLADWTEHVTEGDAE